MAAVDLRTAVLRGDVAALKELLEVRHEPLESRHTAAGLTPLMLASGSASVDIVTYLLDAGANPHLRSWNGDTPLTLAAARTRADVVKALLDAGAEVNGRNDRGMTALHSALAFGSGRRLTQTIRVLLAAGADVSTGDHRGLTPAQAARTRRWTCRVPGVHWELSGSYRVLWRDAVITMLEQHQRG